LFQIFASTSFDEKPELKWSNFIRILRHHNFLQILFSLKGFSTSEIGQTPLLREFHISTTFKIGMMTVETLEVKRARVVTE
jgi:hypothetical protein